MGDSGRAAARELIKSNVRRALRECHVCGPWQEARLDQIAEHVVHHLEQRLCREALAVLAAEESVR
jgi:hypothetical protein